MSLFTASSPTSITQWALAVVGERIHVAMQTNLSYHSHLYDNGECCATYVRNSVKCRPSRTVAVARMSLCWSVVCEYTVYHWSTTGTHTLEQFAGGCAPFLTGWLQWHHDHWRGLLWSHQHLFDRLAVKFPDQNRLLLRIVQYPSDVYCTFGIVPHS